MINCVMCFTYFFNKNVMLPYCVKHVFLILKLLRLITGYFSGAVGQMNLLKFESNSWKFWRGSLMWYIEFCRKFWKTKNCLQKVSSKFIWKFWRIFKSKSIWKHKGYMYSCCKWHWSRVSLLFLQTLLLGVLNFTMIYTYTIADIKNSC